VLSAAVAAVTSVSDAASSVFCFEYTELLDSFLDALVEADGRARADLESGTIPLPPAGVDDVIRLLPFRVELHGFRCGCRFPRPWVGAP